ncbi:MAG: CHAT domain-containing tetratricopeptide repeat protein [Bacteroidota bacterium]
MKKLVTGIFLSISSAFLHPNFSQNDQTIDLAALKMADSIETLAEQYLVLNDFNTSYKLYELALKRKTKVLQKDDILIIRSLIKMAQVAAHSNKLKLAGDHMEQVSRLTRDHPKKYEAVKPSVAFANAKINEYLNLTREADQFYQDFLDLAQKDKGLVKSKFYIDVLTEMSRFHAFHFGPKYAFEYAHLALSAAQSKSHMNTYIHLKALRNIANMYFGFGNYKKGLAFSEAALELFYDKFYGKGHIKYQVHVEKIVPYLIWINVKSKYFLNTKKDVPFLLGLSKQMDDGLNLLNKNKSILFEPENISALFEYYALFFSFGKQLQLDLFQKTKDEAHLIRLIQLHESVLYSKIRKRLHTVENIKFKKISDSVSTEEKLLKANLEKALVNPSFSPKEFTDAERKWLSFLDTLKVTSPKYFKLKYASIEQKIGDLNNFILRGETVVRYLFIEKRLYALILSDTENAIIPLPYLNLGLYNEKLMDYQKRAHELQPVLNTLYHYLWKPLKNKIKTKRVTIIPDGPLFNLNFDLLTEGEIRSFEDLGTKALLSDHTISYNYSLLLHNSERQLLKFERDFVAFAPEFNSQMKSNYQTAIHDSIDLDKSYLSVLPQPFSSETAEKFGKRFSGNYYLNEKASKQLFTKNAKEHKIIHIGTHAESNNVNPELSRLVFAKNISDSTSINDNYLYTYEIYNQNLSSNLAILTACETGKPSFQPGEGMISLAHAFNYAGSESILTSLWQIDEQSSSQILEYFYEYLEDEKPKDEALRLAKLDYLQNAEGRTLHPQYWAGLVLMGDTAPIELSRNGHWGYWIIAGILLLLLLVYFRPWARNP